jgi:protein-arginine deiminase
LRTDVVIDSIRNRGLDTFPERELEGPDVTVMTWGSGAATSQDSFGNVEVTPPFEADGVSWPFGRIYYGEAGAYTPHRNLTDFLEDQLVQDPIPMDTSFLCVGHVDEFMTFVPDATAPKGFRLYMSDVDLFYAALDAMSPSVSLPLYRSGHGFSTVGAIQSDAALRALNADLQTDYIDVAEDLLRAEMGLTDDDIVRFPAVFETVAFCGGATAALVPGTLNLVVGNVSGGPTGLYMPDPHFRANDADFGSDLLVPYFESLLPASHTLHWIDDWDVYHLALGEVHCGTNTVRTPTGSWWTDAMHLIGG